MSRRRLRTVMCSMSLLVGATGTAAAATLGVAPIEKRPKSAPVTKRVSEIVKPVVQIRQEGALGYDWRDWHTVAAAPKDAKLKWRVGTYAVSQNLESAGTRVSAPSDAALSHLFDEERDRSTVVITDTPWRRGGIMTMGMRLEF
ncbi:MAG: hypothetical protein ABW136_07135 [Steroidobacteraceae bacterium]